MGFIMENIERAVGERFMLGEVPYREPTPLVPFRSEGMSLECGQQFVKYLLIYMPFLIPLEQKEVVAINGQCNQEAKVRAISVLINIAMAYVIPAPEPGMPGALYFVG